MLVQEHQKAINEMEKIAEENRKVHQTRKDMQIALLDDDLTDAQQSVVILEHDNLELRAEVERLTTRTVPYLENPEKDNGMATHSEKRRRLVSLSRCLWATRLCGAKNPEQTGKLS